MNNKKVLFNKVAAASWALAGVASFIFGWSNTIWFVVICSIWANVFSSWATAEAADNREMSARLDYLERLIKDGDRSTHPGDCRLCLLYRGGVAKHRSSPLELGSAGTAGFNPGNTSE